MHSAKIRVLVVDDEPLARSNLTTLLRLDADIGEVKERGSGEEAIAEARASKPDLIFLDVQMPEVDGFDVVERLGGDLPQAVVFVTAYDHYALRAFEAGALDYLLKPFDNARFERVLSRVKQKLAFNSAQNMDNKQLTRKTERIVVKTAGQVLFLKPTEIDWIEAADYYVCLHVGPKSHLLRRSMAELEQELDPELFCRVHRSAIVNLNRVQGLKLSADGEHDVQLDTGGSLRLSRRYRKPLQERLGLRANQTR